MVEYPPIRPCTEMPHAATYPANPVRHTITQSVTAIERVADWKALETRTNCGLCGGLLGPTGSSLQAGTPALERGPEIVVQDLSSDLGQGFR